MGVLPQLVSAKVVAFSAALAAGLNGTTPAAVAACKLCAEGLAAALPQQLPGLASGEPAAAAAAWKCMWCSVRLAGLLVVGLGMGSGNSRPAGSFLQACAVCNLHQNAVPDMYHFR
jgi:hypothetical protein